jgi:hypothetical protein
MPFHDPLILFQVLHPLLLVPGLIWIGYRYLPVLAGAGRLRVYLLMAFCAAALGTQVGGIHSQAYPLATWGMYSTPDARGYVWRFVAVSDEGEEDFDWATVAPIRSHRAFARNFAALADEGFGEEDPEEEHLEAAVRLRGILRTLMEVRDRRSDGPPLRGVRVDRCRFDVPDQGGRPAVQCDPVAEVESHAPQ